ncbi:MAG: membrane protein insertion efficiency factor YidD [Chlamydiales bacterium]|nr:membrane protein insertion efficiency factor YidD [Chlamydiales bacterium]
MNFVATLLIRAYQLFISPLLGTNCRFTPTCSQYALQVFQEQPFFKALWLTCKRIAKCNPYHNNE